jgi:hypothetical protein
MKLRVSQQRSWLGASLRSLFWLPALFFAGQPQPAHAEVVTATICTVAQFICPAVDVVATGARSNGVNVLSANRYAILPFSFTSPLIDFSGEVLVADVAGKYITSWGEGTASSGALGLGDYLDVTISQNYVTAPGPWSFDELNSGTCNGNASLAASTSLVEGTVNGAGLPVLGAIGDCAIAPFVYGAGPYGKTVGAVTNMTAAAQFYFSPVGGLAPQAITLPWGNDIPDPNVTGGIITPSNIPVGVLPVPEPGDLGFLGVLPIAVALWRRSFKTGKRAAQLAPVATLRSQRH